jgi:hypothetical protein
MPDGQTDPHFHVLKVAVSDKPEGPFHFCKTLLDKFSIDPHVVRTDNASWTLFYSVNDIAGSSSDRPGTVILEERMADLYTLAGNPQVALYPTRDEEIFARNRFNDGRDWHTIEGAFYFSCDDADFLLYSGGAYTKKFYFIDYAVKNCRGQWHKKYGPEFSPLLQGNAAVEGTGHNSIAVAPNLVDYWIVYHGRDRSVPFDSQKEQRTLRIDPLYYHTGTLSVSGPSACRTRGPAAAPFSAEFDGADTGLSVRDWKIVSGEWSVEDGVLRSGMKGISGIVHPELYSGYILEVSLCWKIQHSGGFFGLYAAYTDDRNFLAVFIDAGSCCVYISSSRNGGLTETRIPLTDRKFNPAVFHLMRIERTGSYFHIIVDSVEVCEYTWYTGIASYTGLVTRYCAADFDAFSLTGHLSFTRHTAEAFWQFISAAECNAWKTEGACLRVMPSAHNKSLAVDHIPFSSFRFSFCFSLPSDAAVGIILAGPGSTDEFSVTNKNAEFQDKQISLLPKTRTDNIHILTVFMSGNSITVAVDDRELSHGLHSASIGSVIIRPEKELSIFSLELTELVSDD